MCFEAVLLDVLIETCFISLANRTFVDYEYSVKMAFALKTCGFISYGCSSMTQLFQAFDLSLSFSFVLINSMVFWFWFF